MKSRSTLSPHTALGHQPGPVAVRLAGGCVVECVTAGKPDCYRAAGAYMFLAEGRGSRLAGEGVLYGASGRLLHRFRQQVGSHRTTLASKIRDFLVTE